MTDKQINSQADADSVAQRLGADLRAREEALPEAVVDKLYAARMQAVQAAQEQAAARQQQRSRYLIPGIGVGASMAGIALVAVLLMPGPKIIEPLPELHVQGDPSVLAVTAEAEMLDDLEFVAWMVMLDEAPEDPAG